MNTPPKPIADIPSQIVASISHISQHSVYRSKHTIYAKKRPLFSWVLYDSNYYTSNVNNLMIYEVVRINTSASQLKARIFVKNRHLREQIRHYC